MIILTTTNDKIQASLGGTVAANQVRCFVSYRDTTTTSITPGRNYLNTNNTTLVDVVAAPASSTQRIVDYMSFYNADTASVVLTVDFWDGSSLYELFSATLGPNEKAEYQEGNGFKVLTTTGAVKTSFLIGTSPTSSSIQSVVLASDVTNNNAVANTIQDVTGLSFSPVVGSTYWFRFVIWYTAAATTTGARWTVNGPATTILRYQSRYSLTTTSETINQGVAAYDTPAASNATSAATNSNSAVIEGFIQTSASGTLIARFASEVASSAIVAKAGSVLYYQVVI